MDGRIAAEFIEGNMEMESSLKVNVSHSGSSPCVNVVVGNYNQRHQLELCLRSLMKHSGYGIERIYIMDNQSTDSSDEFYRSDPWGNFTIVKYDSPVERREDIIVSRISHYEIGMSMVSAGERERNVLLPPHTSEDSRRIKEEREQNRGAENQERKKGYTCPWINPFSHASPQAAIPSPRHVLITHADAEFVGDPLKPFYKFLESKPNLFLCGVGGGDPTDLQMVREIDRCVLARLHEWCLIADVPQYREGNFSFRPVMNFRNPEFYGDRPVRFDCSAFMYYRAWTEGRDIGLIEPEKDYVVHHALGASMQKSQMTEYAVKRLKEIYGIG